MRTTLVLCDLDDGADKRPGIAVIEMTIDGKKLPLDVCKEHLAVLRALPPAPTAASAGSARTQAKASNRPRGTGARRPAKQQKASVSAGAGSQRKPGSRRSRQEQIAQARDWGRRNGREVSDRGRLPAGLLEEFLASAG